MIKHITFVLSILNCICSNAQNEPFMGGIGRGDTHVTAPSNLLDDSLIYYGGVGRGDIHVTIPINIMGDALIFRGGIGRGDIYNLRQLVIY